MTDRDALAESSKTGPKIGFVCGASRRIGGGHVMRCLTLAGELAHRGAVIRFVVNAEAMAFVPALRLSGFSVAAVATLTDTALADDTIWPEALATIVVDCYDLDSRTETSLRARAAGIVVIDDLADRPHDCNLLVDSAWGRQATDYRDLVPPRTTMLLGPRYAPLRPEFAARRDAALARRAVGGNVHRVLVSLGLTDFGGITGRVMARLLGAPLEARFDVVVAPLAESRAVLEALAASDRRLRILVDPPDIAGLMAEADLAVGAGGSTSWERCCLGLPTILMVLADNQRRSADGLERAGAAKVVQGSVGADPRHVAALLTELAGNAGARAAMAAAAAAIVDGQGAARVCDAILVTAGRPANYGAAR